MTTEEALLVYRKRLPRLYRWSAPKPVVAPDGYHGTMVEYARTVDLMLEYFRTGDGFGRYCGCWALNNYGNQTYYVPKDLGRDAIATRLPGTKIRDWRMPFPGIRFALEDGTFPLADGRQLRSVDLAIVPKGTVPALPADVHADLTRARYDLNQNGLATDLDQTVCYAIAHMTAADGSIDPERQFIVFPADEDATLAQVLSEGALASLGDGEMAGDKIKLESAAIALALNCTRLLMRAPEYVEGGDAIMRAPGEPSPTPGGPTHRPRFVGLKYVSKSRRDPGPPTGRKLPEGWRAGHDKWVRFGPGRLQLRLVHVEPYKISDRADQPKQHVGRAGQRADFAVTLEHVSAGTEQGMLDCVFEDDDGNVLTLKAAQPPVAAGDPVFLRATVVRHYMEANKPRTEIKDCAVVYEQEIVPESGPQPEPSFEPDM